MDLFTESQQNIAYFSSFCLEILNFMSQFMI